MLRFTEAHTRIKQEDHWNTLNVLFCLKFALTSEPNCPLKVQSVFICQLLIGHGKLHRTRVLSLYNPA